MLVLAMTPAGALESSRAGCQLENGKMQEVFRSGQIDHPIIYRFVDRSDVVIIWKAALDIDGPGFIWQISSVFTEPIDIYAKEDIYSH